MPCVYANVAGNFVRLGNSENKVGEARRAAARHHQRNHLTHMAMIANAPCIQLYMPQLLILPMGAGGSD